ncbi:MAG: TonB-dependent receptor [Opitutaceae bacterium]|nr:TonB-dependent receptor [Opitutaceae bacterium]
MSALCLAAVPAAAQTTGTGFIEGTIINAATEVLIDNVRVTVEGTEIEAVTDRSGRFRLRNVPAGVVRVRTAYLGMEEQVQTVNVTAEQTVQADFALVRVGRTHTSNKENPEKAIMMDPLAVVEEREMSAQFLAINEQRNAPNLKNVVAFDEYGYTTDGNLGEFLKHIPGVAVDYSASIPVGVSIRGFPNLATGISVDGVLLAGGETTTASRGTSLSQIATDNISRIEVTKVPTPDMPAAGLGGSINIISDSAFARKKPVLKFTAYSTFRGDYPFELKGLSVGAPIEGMGNAHTASHILPSFDFSYLKPVNDSLAISVAGSQILRYIHNDTFFPEWNVSTGVQTASRYRVVPQVATIRSGQFKLDYKLSDRSRVSASFQARKRQATQALGDFRPVYGAGATGDANGVQGAASGVGQVQLLTGFIQRNNANQTSSIKWNYDGNDYKIDASLFYSSGQTDNYDEPNGYLGTVNSSITNVVLNGTGITSDPDEPSTHLPAQLTALDRAGKPVNLGDGGIYSLNSASSSDQRFENTRQGTSFNIQRQFGSSGLTALKAGLFVTQEKQTTQNHGVTYNFRTGQSATVRQARNYGVVDPTLFYQLPPLLGVKVERINPILVYQLRESNPEYFIADEALAHRTRVNNAFRLKEVITAGYIRADFRFVEGRLNLVTGARYERTADSGSGPLVDPSAQFQKDAAGKLVLSSSGAPIPLTTNPLERDRLIYKELGTSQKSSYDGLYPSVNASYQLTKSIIARAGYARTIGRPDLPEIMPGATISANPDTDGVKTITVINTGLKPWTADSYDVALESYLFKYGYGSAGVFMKDITDFFGSLRRPATPEEITQYGGAPNETYDIISTLNAGDARISGFELGYKQSLAFLPGWARGVQAFVNYTRLNLEGSATADFTGYNPETLSWGVSLVRPRFSFKFNMAHQGETRRAQTTPVGSYFWAGAKRRDTWNLEFQATKNLSLFAQVVDLLNGGYIDVQKRYDPTQNTPDYLRYQRLISTGTELTIGVKGRF